MCLYGKPHFMAGLMMYICMRLFCLCSSLLWYAQRVMLHLGKNSYTFGVKKNPSTPLGIILAKCWLYLHDNCETAMALFRSEFVDMYCKLSSLELHLSFVRESGGELALEYNKAPLTQSFSLTRGTTKHKHSCTKKCEVIMHGDFFFFFFFHCTKIQRNP